MPSAAKASQMPGEAGRALGRPGQVRDQEAQFDRGDTRRQGHSAPDG